jgi:hypothetical protein
MNPEEVRLGINIFTGHIRDGKMMLQKNGISQRIQA